MSNKTVFFGYVSFLRDKIDAAIEIMTKRENDYLWICFNASRVVQDGPGEEHPNLGFSIILDTDDADDIVNDIENIIRQLPFLSATLVVRHDAKASVRLFTYHLQNTDMVKSTRF